MKTPVEQAEFTAFPRRKRGRGRVERRRGLVEISGATGGPSGLANVQPELSVRLRKALRIGDAATVGRLWQLIRPFERLRAEGASENNVSVVKEALAQLGVCRRDVRPPSHVLDEAKRQQVRDILASWEIAG